MVDPIPHLRNVGKTGGRAGLRRCLPVPEATGGAEGTCGMDMGNCGRAPSDALMAFIISTNLEEKVFSTALEIEEANLFPCLGQLPPFCLSRCSWGIRGPRDRLSSPRHPSFVLHTCILRKTGGTTWRVTRAKSSKWLPAKQGAPGACSRGSNGLLAALYG